EFPDLDSTSVVGMVRTMGFSMVHETAFGADLVAAEYRRLLEGNDGKRYIATTCPAVVAYVERYHPDLLPSLAPIVSPMIATARALRRIYRPPLKVVFIGPCVAKKGEAASRKVASEVDAVLTFVEFREMIHERAIDPQSVEATDFDPPHAGAGLLYPISRGILQAAGLPEDLLAGEVVAADGRGEFIEAIREFEGGDLDARLLEVLCCNGCIMGPGISSKAPLFNRRAQVSRYAKRRMTNLDLERWHKHWSALADLNLRREFSPHDQRIAVPSLEQLTEILHRLGKFKPEDELNCGACGYETCFEHAAAIYKGLAESEMCLPYTIEQLKHTCRELAFSNEQLASTQEALMQSEKLASMGQLAAGIAHEVNNPLGTVLMLSHILLDELQPDDERKEDLALIVSEADRCKKIVSGLLQFARKNKVDLEMTDIREVVARCARTLRLPENVHVRTEHNGEDPMAELDQDQIAQVLMNLATNAIAAMPNGGELVLRTDGNDGNVRFSVSDTGVGIPPENRKKIFEPFFTTKPAGQGTGLGLAVSYGIVKMHQGDIRVESNANPAMGPTGSTFTVTLPRKRIMQ
ncbi:MAG TPA: [Fe-Fe] hydrogenase large subunit C-terminal domain-containing protein, partial [Phycisphaerae bacterium]|nr:[Fe-Fe] hydrogenase large subunit C-terminal domain-containing protein [Phycisphaerae bacterium]